MHGYSIRQRNHPQVFAQFRHKYPVTNPPVFRLHFLVFWIGDGGLAPFQADVRALCQHIISEIVGHWQVDHGGIITAKTLCNQATYLLVLIEI